MKNNEHSDASDSSSTTSNAWKQRWTALAPRTRRFVTGVVPLVLLVALLGSVRLHGYVQSDPQFCLGACHVETAQRDLLAQGPHKDTACAQCHQLRFSQNAWLWALGKLQGPTANAPHAHVGPALCDTCHASGVGSKLRIDTSVGHQAHATKAKLECAGCHGDGTHDLSPKHGACKDCHTTVRVFDEGMQAFPCESCHKFLTPAAGPAPTPSTECRTCHSATPTDPSAAGASFVKHGRGVSKEMIHGSIFSCSTCHQPHKQKIEERRAGRNCARCHTGTPENAASIKNPAHSECGTCHREHSLRSQLTSTCAQCHAEARPDKLRDTPAAKHANCGSCHRAHDFVADRSACASCHRDQSPLANVERLKAHADCGSCHAPHTPSAEREACASCHEKFQGHGHEHCVTCHDPHKDKSSTKTCSTCHPGATVAAGKGGHAGGCQTCHTTHAAGNASGRCKTCHGAVAKAVSAAADTPHGKCATCHRPHAFVASAGKNGCLSCHKIPSTGAHRGDCSTCHTTHGSPSVGTASCAKCHQDIPRAKQGKHSDCRSCHAPHEAAVPGAATCTQCHAGQQAGVRAWPAPQHQSCLGCHKAHNPAAAASCTQCHQNTKASGPKQHTCAGCHDPHQAPGNWQGRCGNCHKGQASAVRGRGTTHGNCASCHKPHHVSKPSCTTCHNAMARLGAHANAGHGRCTACHDTHGRATTTRGKCLSCHKDMTGHHPSTQTCASCHPFK